MNYEEWEKTVPPTIASDSLWRMKVYRLALCVGDIGRHDVTKPSTDRHTLSLSDQLNRALGAISANPAEGYSRCLGKDRAKMHEYALGSARESRDWYWKARHILGEEVVTHRLDLISQIVRLPLVIVPAERTATLRDEPAEYEA